VAALPVFVAAGVGVFVAGRLMGAVEWVIVTIYLPFAIERPGRAEVTPVRTRAECQERGRKWAANMIAGRAWFFCQRRVSR
jgi:hypothetical protein